MQQNASGGRYINEMGVLGIVGKNPDASLLDMENFCPCTLGLLLARYKLARAAAIIEVNSFQ